MKQSILFLLITIYSFHCCAQDIAMIAPKANDNTLYYSAGFMKPERVHRQSILGTVGTWTMLGGVVVAIGGYIEVKGATKTYGPYTITNQTQETTGQAIEILGGTLFTAGLTMIIIDAVNRHSHRAGKVGIVVPKNNEIGIAYNF